MHFNEEQYENAFLGIVLIVSGIVISVNLLHFQNSSSPISIFGCASKKLTILILFFLAARCNGVAFKILNSVILYFS